MLNFQGVSQFSHPATETSKPWRFGFLCHAAWISGNTTSQCERHRRRRRWFFFYLFFGVRLALESRRLIPGYPPTRPNISPSQQVLLSGWYSLYPRLDMLVPWRVEHGTFIYVAMILKLFVPDPLWGRLIDILFRTMPLPNHVQPWQYIHKMELQKPFVQTMDFMQMC